MRHHGAGSCIVLPASWVFSPVSTQIFFSAGWPGDGIWAVVIYSVHVWRRRGALDPCNSGMFMLCLLACMIASKISDFNAGPHALCINTNPYIIIRLYSICKRVE